MVLDFLALTLQIASCHKGEKAHHLWYPAHLHSEVVRLGAANLFRPVGFGSSEFHGSSAKDITCGWKNRLQLLTSQMGFLKICC
jgi:hypothetical protein